MLARIMMLLLLVAVAASCSREAGTPVKPEASPAARTDRPTYGQDKGGQRFSTLRQINAGNVRDLQVAWQYHMRPAKTAMPSADKDARVQAVAEGLGLKLSPPNLFLATQATPLVVADVVYVGTPYQKYDLQLVGVPVVGQPGVQPGQHVRQAYLEVHERV